MPLRIAVTKKPQRTESGAGARTTQLAGGRSPTAAFDIMWTYSGPLSLWERVRQNGWTSRSRRAWTILKRCEFSTL